MREPLLISTSSLEEFKTWFFKEGKGYQRADLSLSIYYVLVVRYGWKEDQIRSKIEPFDGGLNGAYKSSNSVFDTLVNTRFLTSSSSCEDKCSISFFLILWSDACRDTYV